MSKSRGKRSHIRVGERRIIDTSRAWYVAATWGIDTPYDESTADRKADAALRDLGLDVWMPTYKEIVVRRGKKLDCCLHFFPGYLFIGLDGGDGHDQDMRLLRRCRFVTNVMGVDGPLRIPGELVQVIADEFTGNVKSERLQAAALFKIGEITRVADGPFASFFAIVTELLQSGRVMGEVDVFGRMVPVHFEPSQLERA